MDLTLLSLSIKVFEFEFEFDTETNTQERMTTYKIDISSVVNLFYCGLRSFYPLQALAVFIFNSDPRRLASLTNHLGCSRCSFLKVSSTDKTKTKTRVKKQTNNNNKNTL